ncbi:OLC1v1027790C1 [Oldenlandia corymbosa var. corymbosa]|uniref:protein-serine/threonine phosphatase n=1 Tax=Oldenlandia corymbosa var. corymbosa TaxID=529605 RepID=A0AAV1CA95_OLDCO|nr:OLC1v1027790C1 [Oldenlandia corymbosa var. corymbosa]
MMLRRSYDQNRMIDNFNICHQTTPSSENGCRTAALSHSHGIMDRNSGRPGGRWEREMDHETMLRDMQERSKRKRQMEDQDDVSSLKGSSASSTKDGALSCGQDERGSRSWCSSYGCISVIGRRREMEDAVAVELGLSSAGEGGEGSGKYDFFGVYDGHGGSRVAHACSDRLHRLLAEIVTQEERGGSGVVDWEKVMLECFEKMDEEVNRNGAAVATMGSTAVVAVVGDQELVVANCGDSRAVLRRGGVAVPLSSDHKPDRADELERIELCGGKVINWNGQRVLGVLATSRSIGDEYLKPYVIPVPQVTVNQRSDLDEFLILASDGLWDVIPNDLACQIVRRCLDGNVRRRAASPQQIPSSGVSHAGASESKNGGLASEAASILAELALARGSRDNISVIVVQLEKPKASSG